jgi:hypothetical protein
MYLLVGLLDSAIALQLDLASAVTGRFLVMAHGASDGCVRIGAPGRESFGPPRNA